MSHEINPLQQFFRQPAIYLRLPSDGAYWPENALVMPDNHEIPVYPMTAIDEITYRTPDSVFSGQATINVIQSCVPNIKDAWSMPSIDLNAVLTAIRMASYGHDMDLISICPKCSNEGEFTADLRNVLDNIKSGDYDQGLKYGELSITLRPMSYRDQNDINMQQFEQQKYIQNVQTSDQSEEEKVRLLSDTLKKVTELTIIAMARCIVSIKTGTDIVTNYNHIVEFLSNCDRKLFTSMRDAIIGLREASELPPMKIKCGNCEHEYEQALVLDQSSFFGVAS